MNVRMRSPYLILTLENVRDGAQHVSYITITVKFVSNNNFNFTYNKAVIICLSVLTVAVVF